MNSLYLVLGGLVGGVILSEVLHAKFQTLFYKHYSQAITYTNSELERFHTRLQTLEQAASLAKKAL